MNTEFIHPWNLAVIATVSIFTYWALMRFAPQVTNGDK